MLPKYVLPIIEECVKYLLSLCFWVDPNIGEKNFLVMKKHNATSYQYLMTK